MWKTQREQEMLALAFGHLRTTDSKAKKVFLSILSHSIFPWQGSTRGQKKWVSMDLTTWVTCMGTTTLCEQSLTSHGL